MNPQDISVFDFQIIEDNTVCVKANSVLTEKLKVLGFPMNERVGVRMFIEYVSDLEFQDHGAILSLIGSKKTGNWDCSEFMFVIVLHGLKALVETYSSSFIVIWSAAKGF